MYIVLASVRFEYSSLHTQMACLLHRIMGITHKKKLYGSRLVASGCNAPYISNPSYFLGKSSCILESASATEWDLCET
jgi:hypothetical protein